MIKKIGQHADLEINEIADKLIIELGEKWTEEGFLYVGYPIFYDELTRNKLNVDLLLLLKRGVFIINVLKNTVPDYNIIQDAIYNKTELKLKKYQFLLNGRNLKFDLKLITLQIDGSFKEIQDYPIVGDVYSLSDFIIKHAIEQFDSFLFDSIISGFQEAYGINKREKITEDFPQGSKAFAISRLDKTIETYDPYQMEAILSDPKGIQRIRGMAGSGKTVVLARKAVELHSAHPEWDIVVTYYTRSLKDQLHELILRFYGLKNEGRTPDFKKLKLMQAWGSSNAPGVYYEICLHHEISPYWYKIAKAKYGYEGAFAGVCEELQNAITNYKHMYDCIIIDEAQDLNNCFLRLCYEVLKPEKRLVYAYDELQNLGNDTMPSPKDIFGRDIAQDTPLAVCYRNQKNVIVTAHAIGMGLYREPEGLIQIPGSQDVWTAIGYKTDKEIIDGEVVRLFRTSETSPDLLNVKEDELVNVFCYQDIEQQYDALNKMLEINILEDKLRPKHIIIIDMDAVACAENSSKFLKYSIFFDNTKHAESVYKTHLAGTAGPEDFLRDDSIVYSSVYRAKGNEAFYVYIVNAQKCINSLSSSKDRNSLFTAITRSKGWVSILGCGDGIKKLSQEFLRIKEENYTLYFKEYPDEKKRKQLIINSEDITETEQHQIFEMKNIIKKYRNLTPQIMLELFGVDSIDEIIKMLSSSKGK